MVSLRQKIFMGLAASFALTAAAQAQDLSQLPKPKCKPFHFVDIHCDSINQPFAHFSQCSPKDVFEIDPNTGGKILVAKAGQPQHVSLYKSELLEREKQLRQNIFFPEEQKKPILAAFQFAKSVIEDVQSNQYCVRRAALPPRKPS